MSVIKVTLPPGEIPVEGKQVSFKAPCPCDVTEAIQIEGENYIVCDSLGKCVTGVGGVWDVGSIVSVILSVEQKKAYIQNSAKHATAYGSYVGTGTYGQANPNSLTFDFVPKAILFYGKMRIGVSEGVFAYPNRPLVMLCESGEYSFDFLAGTSIATGHVEVDGTTVSWYANSNNAYDQMNYGNETYYYVAFG